MICCVFGVCVCVSRTKSLSLKYLHPYRWDHALEDGSCRLEVHGSHLASVPGSPGNETRGHFHYR